MILILLDQIILIYSWLPFDNISVGFRVLFTRDGLLPRCGVLQVPICKQDLIFLFFNQTFSTFPPATLLGHLATRGWT